MNRAPVLLSRSLDPVLGVFTGALAFYLHETNPRTAPPPGESLLELVRWKRAKWARVRAEKVEAEASAELGAAVEMLKEEERKARA